MKPAVFAASAFAYLLMITLLPASWLSEAGGLLSLCLQGLSPVSPDSIWTAWSLAPAVAIPLAVWAVGHGVRLNRSGAPGKESALAACGFLLLGVAVLSPLCRLAASLAWVHMVQHVVLVALAPPLLVLGSRAVQPSKEAGLPHRVIGHPGRCAAIYGLLIWLWHVPRFYEAALLDPRVHLLMYGSLIVAAMLFWTSILSARRTGAAHAPNAMIWAIVALLITFVHTGLLGALLLFSPRSWYPILQGTGAIWGFPPLADQQLAGLIMWVPMGAIYLLAALWVASGALASMRARADAHDALIE